MLHYKVGNLLDAPQKVIAHQVNCRGVMGSGIAKAIRDKYPSVYSEYVARYHNFSNEPSSQGGDMMLSIVNSDRYVANLYGQDSYGYGERHTNYIYLIYSLRKLCETLLSRGITEFAIPYKMGCDRGGGKWDFVEEILEDLSNIYRIDIFIYSLDGYK